MRTAKPIVPQLVDAAVIAVMVVVAGQALAAAYGGRRYLAVLVAGAVIGALAAVLPSWVRWPAWTTVPAAVVGYLLCSGIAVPANAAGALPTLQTVRISAIGVVTSWKQMLTVAVPIGSSGALLIPALIASTLASVVGVLVALRTRRPLIALLAPGAMAVAAAALGATTPSRPALVGSVLAVGALVWAGWRRRRGGLAGLELRRPIGIALILLPALAAGLLLGPSLLSGAPRAAARTTVQPPFDPQAYPSPLGGFRKYVKAERDTVLMDVSGLPAGGRIRLAVLDSYDGTLYGTSANTGTFTRVGDQISGAPAGTAVRLTVSVRGYSGVWLPDAGYLSGISFGGPRAAGLTGGFRYDRRTGTGVEIEGLAAGDSYTADVSIPEQPAAAAMAGVAAVDISQPDPENVPDVVKSKAQEWAAGAADPYAIATALADHLKQTGYFSHGGDGTLPSPAGHGADRMIRLLTAPTMVGDQEQYSVAMALMARSLGLPARVVMGFAPKASGGSAAPLPVRGSDVTAWVEIDFDGVGWVAFDPTPDEAKVPQQQSKDQQQQAHQQQVQPPPPPPEQQRPQTTTEKDPGSQDTDKPDDQQDKQTPPAATVVPVGVILAIGIPILLIVLPLLLVILLKLRRRLRRRAGPPILQIAGGWSEIVDRARDLGVSPMRGATRGEAAERLDGFFGGSTAVLARDADTGVFSPDPVEAAAAESFWTAAEAEMRQMGQARPRWRRALAAVSPASLRRSRRYLRSGRRAGGDTR